MQARCPRCGAELAADAAECPTCAYGDVEEIVLLEAQAPGPPAPRQNQGSASPLPRVFAAVAILVVVVAAIFAALR